MVFGVKNGDSLPGNPKATLRIAIPLSLNLCGVIRIKMTDLHAFISVTPEHTQGIPIQTGLGYGRV